MGGKESNVYSRSTHCNFRGTESVVWRFTLKPARDEGLMQILEVFMSCESFQLLGLG